ncbi:gag-pol polyprotein [Cucumis melo var. makuwa]|uniref:Gag-pol polyprotein n=1 Tax=Cucumis melo var. makuwa TaxID=1194695 RepID=A0A5D3DUR8_CUCMM|nr:gag-pol polyprotein [Cucumis melo var. makuwa]
MIRPPMLYGADYGYWKARMIAFLKSMDRKCWKAVLTGWEPPFIKDATSKMALKLKSPGQRKRMKRLSEIHEP